jgi:TRAP-type transport system large permease protein
VADTAALAAVLMPMMRKAGYQPNRSAGLIAAGGIIAPVIPPSIGWWCSAWHRRRLDHQAVPRRHRAGLMMGLALWASPGGG